MVSVPTLSHARVPVPMKINRLISLACDALPPSWPASTTIVLPATAPSEPDGGTTGMVDATVDVVVLATVVVAAAVVLDAVVAGRVTAGLVDVVVDATVDELDCVLVLT